MLTIKIGTSSAAFTTPEGECARILRGVADRLAYGQVTHGERHSLCDINGNPVGFVELVPVCGGCGEEGETTGHEGCHG